MKSVAPLNGEHAPESWLYVRDVDTSEWHVVSDFGILAPRQTWALCGRWPNRRSGWSEAHTDRAGLAIHDVCRYWAGIGGPWLYVRSWSSGDWHVIRDAGDGRAHVPALCGHVPDTTDGWTRLAKKPVGLELHNACRVRRDQVDLEKVLTQTPAFDALAYPDGMASPDSTYVAD
jgi:hypothetical protein